MKTANKMLIEVLNNQVIGLLQQLEQMNLIHLSTYNDEIGRGASTPVKSIEPLSKRFAGALHLTDEEYNRFQTSIKNGRNEWIRAL
jgi:hypothetical protein